MSSNPRLLFDVDGTLANFHKRCVEWANIHIENRFTMDLATRFRRIEKGLDLTDSETETLYNMIGSEGFNSVMEPIEGCEILSTLATNYEVFFVTDRHRESKTWVYDRDRWLERVFGSTLSDRVVYTGHKYIIQGNLLIEDTPEIARKWWTHQHSLYNYAEPLLISWQYNASCGMPTFQSWKEFPTAFEAFLKRYQNHEDRLRLQRLK